jgi:hypothetical protein
MKDEHIQIRTYDVTYMKYVTKWWDILLPGALLRRIADTVAFLY